MTLDEQISAALRASSTLAALVGDRIFHVMPPDNVDAPFIVFQETTVEPTPTYDSLGTDLVFVEYQVACWAATPAAAKGLRSALTAVIGGAATPFARALAQTIGTTIVDPATRLHQAVLVLRIPSAI